MGRNETATVAGYVAVHGRICRRWFWLPAHGLGEKMNIDLTKVYLYHITDIENLPSILSAGALLCDAKVGGTNAQTIGYTNIKNRRMREISIPCCGNRFVGEFVPFYFCPRSPMLFTVNRGNTGRDPGCQRSIVHLVTSISHAIALNRVWTFSNGNAGAYHADFFGNLAELDKLDWEIIQSTDWGGDLRRHKKAAEFLIADSFDWSAIRAIGCYDQRASSQVQLILDAKQDSTKVVVRRDWYYS